MTYVLTFSFILTAVLFYYTVIVPVREAQSIRAKEEFSDAYRAFKLYYVKKHYEAVKELSYEDIKKDYDFHSAYDALSVKRKYQ